MERTCKKCGEIKPIESFRNKYYKDWPNKFSHTCKLCEAKHSKEYQIKNRGKRKLYEKNNLKRLNEQHKKWRDSNHERVLECERKYWKNNLERKRILQKQWTHNNREIVNKAAKLRQKKYVEKLLDSYIIARIKNEFKMEHKIIKENPELIENYRQQIKVKRLLKQKKHENAEAS